LHFYSVFEVPDDKTMVRAHAGFSVTWIWGPACICWRLSLGFSTWLSRNETLRFHWFGWVIA
jgi:hypothetical protein